MSQQSLRLHEWKEVGRGGRGGIFFFDCVESGCREKLEKKRIIGRGRHASGRGSKIVNVSFWSRKLSIATCIAVIESQYERRAAIGLGNKSVT